MVWIGALAAFVVVFAFRWLTLSEFPNDHFDHVAIAQQLRLGAWPIRDFTDEGLPLAYLVSAAAWSLIKSPFLSEAIVVASGFATAAALSVAAAARLSGSFIAASIAVVAQLALYPRTYSYPKLLVQAVAVAVALWALERPTARRLAALAGATALGYYFRHDHAISIGAATLAALCVAHWRLGISAVTRAVARYAALVIACVLPHLLYVQWAAGIPTYFAIARQYVTAEAAVGAYRLPVPSLDPKAGLWLRRDAPAIHIRWRPALDAASRTRLEARYQLDVVEQTDSTTWRYRIRDTEPANLTALRSDANVEDTHGFDRIDGADSHGLQLGPGWRARENSLAILYWLWWLLPSAAVAVLYARRPHLTPVEAAGVTMAVVLALGANLGFLRSPLEIRLPDVAVPQTILGAWLGATLWRWRSNRLPQLLRRGVVVAATVKALIAIALLSQAGQLVQTAGLTRGPGGVGQRWREVSAQLRSTPGPIPSNPSQLLLPFFEYVQECTGRDDRLLYAWYSPEVYIVANRAFAGDHRKFFAPFHATPWEQARTIERLKQERVPFVLIPRERRQSFEAGYPAVWEYLRSRYVLMATIPDGDPAGTEILRDASWTGQRVYRATTWPCVQ